MKIKLKTKVYNLNPALVNDMKTQKICQYLAILQMSRFFTQKKH